MYKLSRRVENRTTGRTVLIKKPTGTIQTFEFRLDCFPRQSVEFQGPIEAVWSYAQVVTMRSKSLRNAFRNSFS